MSFAVVLEGMTFVAFIVMLSSGVQKRSTGWKILTAFLVIVVAVQCVAVGLIVSYLYPSIGYILILHRHTSTKSTIASSLAGTSTPASYSAPLAGASKFSSAEGSSLVHSCWNKKAATNCPHKTLHSLLLKNDLKITEQPELWAYKIQYWFKIVDCQLLEVFLNLMP